MNLLYVYPIIPGSMAYEMYKALKRQINGKIYKLIDEKENYFSSKVSFKERLLWKLKLPYDKYKINKRLLNYDLSKIDAIFFIKGNEIYPSTLKYIKKKYPYIKLISWSLDDMYAWHNRSIYYTFGLRFYDLVVTTKSYNVKELKKLGAKKILFQYQAYSRDLHKPCNDCDKVKYQHDVIFIGDFENDRFEKMLFLANNGIKIYIYGPNWHRKIRDSHENLIINPPLIGENYSKALSCSKISLCFLKKSNRDLHTSRSIEIPACKGFMIAERTNEHKKIFEEDKEAVFFETKEELLEKVRFYLLNNEKRIAIAHAGYNKVINSEFSYDDRAKEILKMISKE